MPQSTFFFVILIIVLVITVAVFLTIVGLEKKENNTNSLAEQMTRSIHIKIEKSDSKYLLPLTITEIMDPGNSTLIKIQKIILTPQLTENEEKPAYYKPRSPYMKIVNSDGNDMVDHKHNPFTFPDTLPFVKVTCKNQKERISYFAEPTTMPILKTDELIHIEYSDYALKPDKDGLYNLHFSSFYDVEIEMPENAVIIIDERESCFKNNEPSVKIFFYDIQFKLE